MIIGGSKTIGNFLHDWIQRRTDTPELDLTEYSFDHVNSVINFFYTHDLIVEHSCYTSDLDRLVQKFDCQVLTRRFRTIKMMYRVVFWNVRFRGLDLGGWIAKFWLNMVI